MLLTYNWSDLVGESLGPDERRCVESLAEAAADVRDGSTPVSSDRCERVLDEGERLLRAIGAPDVATKVADERAEFRRLRFLEDQKRAETLAARALDVRIDAGKLPAWRDVVTPHDDVATGSFELADFAADLRLVHQGKARDEYGDPVEFFTRTYMTRGLHDLLGQTVRRMNGAGGDPVIDLMTTFGGGKTHSMLAVYHATSGVPAIRLDGLPEVCADAGVADVPSDVKRVLIVGDDFSVLGATKPDGTVVNTMAGEIAWQLGGPEGYAAVGTYDRASAPPPATVLEDLLNMHSPCVILVDEWVMYLRQLWNPSGEGDKRPAGTFEEHLSFVQGLTSALKGAPRAMLIASLPASDSVRDMGKDFDADSIDNAHEVGGTAGVEALRALRSVIHRTERPWQPADLVESFEIVRRRLFKPFGQKEEAARSLVVEGFHRLYVEAARELPSEVTAGNYETLMRHAYPVHPELFARLFEDWSTLERFQRTRGVLRLMATVVHSLWTRGDQGPVILPASVPLDDPKVVEEFTRVLDDKWGPVIATDLAGSSSTAAQVDREITLYGRTQATQRAARCVFLGSVPGANRRDSEGRPVVNRGIERKRVALGATYPGDNLGHVVGALQKLAEDGTYVARDEDRYSLGLSHTLAQLVREKADGYHDTDIVDELTKLIRSERGRGAFARLHAFPGTSADVDDEPSAGLVIFGPDRAYRRADKGKPPSAGEKAAQEFLERRGSQARVHKNELVFLLPDADRIDNLLKLVRNWRAWASIVAESDRYELTPAMKRDAEGRRKQNEDAMREALKQTYRWLLNPEQEPGDRDIRLSAIPMNGDGTLAERATKKVRTSEYLCESLSVSTLRYWIDRLNLWKREGEPPHIELGKLISYFTQYPYLPRIVDQGVLFTTVRDRPDSTMVMNDGFAYAAGHDGSRYVGLTLDPVASVSASGLIVDPEVARTQLDTERAQEAERESKAAADAALRLAETNPDAGGLKRLDHVEQTELPTVDVPTPPVATNRLFGNVELDPVRSVRQIGLIDAEVITLMRNNGVTVQTHLEITAEGLDLLAPDILAALKQNLGDLGVEFEIQ